MTHSLLLVLVIAAVTYLTRLLPFLLFGGKREPPEVILYLGRVLPYAVMALLVVYCLRSIELTVPPFGAPSLIAVAACVLLHLWRRNTLLSIIVSTALYMVLTQQVF